MNVINRSYRQHILLIRPWATQPVPNDRFYSCSSITPSVCCFLLCVMWQMEGWAHEKIAQYTLQGYTSVLANSCKYYNINHSNLFILVQKCSTIIKQTSYIYGTISEGLRITQILSNRMHAHTNYNPCSVYQVVFSHVFPSVRPSVLPSISPSIHRPSVFELAHTCST